MEMLTSSAGHAVLNIKINNHCVGGFCSLKLSQRSLLHKDFCSYMQDWSTDEKSEVADEWEDGKRVDRW